MRRARVLAGAAAVTALTAAALVGPGTGTASAATYDGQDPIASGCASNTDTVASAPIYRTDGTQVGTMELRYSVPCGTVWARVVSYYSTGYAYVHRSSDGASERCGNALTWSSSLNAYSCYTPMLNDWNTMSYAYGANYTIAGWSQVAATASY